MPRYRNDYEAARAAGILWTPQALRSQALLKRWWDAGSLGTVSASGTSVVSIRDRSGNGDTASPGGTASSFVNNNAIRNSSTGQCVVPSTSLSYPVDYAVVGTPLGTGDYRILFNTGTNFPGIIEVTTSKWGIYAGGFVQAGSLTWGNQLGQGYFRGVNSTTLSMGRDGDALQTCSATCSWQDGCIGCNYNTGGSVWGDWYEVVCMSTLSAADRDRVTGYLAWRWDELLGVGTLKSLLPVAHPYKKRPPLIGT